MIGFGKYSMSSQAIITSLEDVRLVRINPQTEGFFDTILNYIAFSNRIELFIEAIKEVKDAKLKPFYKPIYDPSEGIGEIPVIYQKGEKPAVGHSYNWWVEATSKMPTIEGMPWVVQSEYQRYAFLAHIVNKKVESGMSIADTLYEVVDNSYTLGHYHDSKDSTNGQEFEPTGSRCVFGFYDLGNTYKFNKCSNKKAGGYWVSGGYYKVLGSSSPLADLEHETSADKDSCTTVAELVLSEDDK